MSDPNSDWMCIGVEDGALIFMDVRMPRINNPGDMEWAIREIQRVDEGRRQIPPRLAKMALSPGYNASRPGNKAFTGCLSGKAYRALAR